MNEKIKEFALQAGIVYEKRPELDVWIAFNIELEKFAELIVEECVEQILTGVRTNPPQAAPPELVKTLVRRIQQHFGVEP
jgi:hypothetical protein